MEAEGWLHLPCLALDGVIVAMSMPNPPKNKEIDVQQRGHLAGTWGKLLPGWFLKGGRVYGPAGPEQGLELPTGACLDIECFLHDRNALANGVSSVAPTDF